MPTRGLRLFSTGISSHRKKTSVKVIIRVWESPEDRVPIQWERSDRNRRSCLGENPSGNRRRTFGVDLSDLYQQQQNNGPLGECDCCWLTIGSIVPREACRAAGFHGQALTVGGICSVILRDCASARWLEEGCRGAHGMRERKGALAVEAAAEIVTASLRQW